MLLACSLATGLCPGVITPWQARGPALLSYHWSTTGDIGPFHRPKVSRISRVVDHLELHESVRQLIRTPKSARKFSAGR